MTEEVNWNLARATRLAKALTDGGVATFVETFDDDVYLSVRAQKPAENLDGMLSVWWAEDSWQVELGSADGRQAWGTLATDNDPDLSDVAVTALLLGTALRWSAGLTPLDIDHRGELSDEDVFEDLDDLVELDHPGFDDFGESENFDLTDVKDPVSLR